MFWIFKKNMFFQADCFSSLSLCRHLVDTNSLDLTSVNCNLVIFLKTTLKTLNFKIDMTVLGIDSIF